mmetsp:Transcript_39376/g.103083  ORF Transcript_39376/g.103083 Transcript_39376/m.103083 type:complete len:427 (-) Transcript_39376:93-1373(-)
MGDEAPDVLSEAVQKLAALKALVDAFVRDEPACLKARDELLGVLDGLSEADIRRPQKAEIARIRGECLGAFPETAKQGEDLLAKAVKLAPKNIHAWNGLGELQFARGDLEAAQTCFEKAVVGEATDCVALRRLSMVLRRLPASKPEDKTANFALALEKAKAALKCNMKDPYSWSVLGNAYFAEGMVNTASAASHKQRATQAYQQAETLFQQAAIVDADLHFNRGTLRAFWAEYGLALEDFNAVVAATGMQLPQIAAITSRIEKTRGAMDCFGKVKPKKASEALAGIPDGELVQGTQVAKVGSLSSLRAGAADCLVGRCVEVLPVPEGQTSTSALCVDCNGKLFVLSVFFCDVKNMVKQLSPLKTLLFVRKPDFHAVSVQLSDGSVLEYEGVRALHPSLVSLNQLGSHLGSHAASADFSTGQTVSAS